MRRINFIKFVVLGLGVAFAGCCLLPEPSLASNHAVSLTAAPAVIDTGGESGVEVAFSFQLSNNGDTDLPVHMSTRESRVRDGQTEELMRSLSAKDWIVFAEPDFILQAKETRRVNATLHIPGNASPGGHYADLIVQSLSLEEEEGIIASQPELAVQMFISVTGDIREELSVTNEGPSSILFNRTALNTLSFAVKNTGNTHTLFVPKLYLTNRKHALTVDSQPEILLPGEKRTISFVVPTTTQLRVYGSQVKLTYGAPTREIASPEMHLIILPFSPMLVLVIPLLLAALYAYHVRTRVIRAIRIIARGA